MPSSAAEHFRTNIARILRERGVTMTDCARKAGISRPGLHRILYGQERVTLERAERIARSLNFDLATLILTGHKKKPKEPLDVP